jgi:hypothetical protein
MNPAGMLRFSSARGEEDCPEKSPKFEILIGNLNVELLYRSVLTAFDVCLALAVELGFCDGWNLWFWRKVGLPSRKGLGPSHN